MGDTFADAASIRRRRVRRRGPARRARRGMAPLEVVMITGLMIPSLIGLLYLGFKAMAAFLSVAGTMIGSPFF